MSLISDALKTAQRERSGRVSSGSGGQPLLEGFFPYVSTSPPAGRSRLTRVVVISFSSLVLLGAAGWLSVPAIKRVLAARSQKSAIVLPPQQVAQTPASDTAAQAVTDTQTVATEVVESAPTSKPPEIPPSSPRHVAAENRAIVRSADPNSVRSDTAIAQPGAVITQAPPSSVNPATNAPIRVDYEAQATVLFNLGDLQGAREKFLLATRYAPTARTWTNYGVTLQRLGELSAAAGAYQAAIGIDGNYLEAWLYQGRVAVLRGESHKAVPLFQRARSINPRHSEVNTELAELESKAMHWTETRRFAEDGVRGDATNSRAHWFLAISSDQLSDFETAAREYAAYLQTVGAAEKDNLQSVGHARMRLQQLKGKT